MKIFQNFDGGNIEVVDARPGQAVHLAIRPDQQGQFLQWFYFAVEVDDLSPLQLVITNASAATYVEGWQGYQALMSYDRQHWFRTPTQYQQGQLWLSCQPQARRFWLAYFVPYSFERHQELMAVMQQRPGLCLRSLGTSVQGRSLDLLVLGNPSGKQLWLTGRQHPGETMASWYLEALLYALTDPNCALAQGVLAQAQVHVVVNANPDGSVLGHLRTNAAGVDLNRAWQVPSLEHSPEVYGLQQAMLATGVDWFLDVHGDETIPYTFIAGQQGMEGLPAWIEQAEQAFKASYAQASPDFQQVHGYAPGQFGEQALSMASFWVGRQFQCPSMTLEMPFKDHLQPGQTLPRRDPSGELQGWTVDRTQALAQALLIPLLQWLKTSINTE